MRSVVRSSCIAALLSIGAVAFAQTTGQNPTGASGQAGTPTMTRDAQTGDRAQTQQQITLVGCIQREADYRQAAGSGRGGTLGTGMGVGNEFVLVNASQGSGAGSQSAMSGASTPPSSSTPSTPTGTSPATGTGTASTTGTTGGTTSGTAGATTSGTAGGATTSGTTTGTATGTPPGTTAGATAGTTSGTATGTMTGTAPATVMKSGGTAYALSGSRERDLEQYVGQRVEIVGTIEGGSARSGSTAGGSGYGTGTSTATTPGTTTSGTAPGTSTGTTASGTGTASASASGTQRFGDLQQVNIVSFKPVGGSCTP